MAGETPGVEIVINDVTDGSFQPLLRCRSACWPNLKAGDRFVLWSVRMGDKDYAKVDSVVQAVSYQYSGKDLHSPLCMVVNIKIVEAEEKSEIQSCQTMAHLG